MRVHWSVAKVSLKKCTRVERSRDGRVREVDPQSHQDEINYSDSDI